MEQNPLDTVKLAVSLTILIGGLVAFYYYADASKLLRVGGVIAAVVVAIAVAFQTDKGRQVSSFIREAQIEVRKVVWPTREETTQTTMVVIIVVVIFALLLWLLDLMLGGLVQMVIGRGS
jgi:preprotein translocase subunit SecE